MKYWSELNKIENRLTELDMTVGLVNVIAVALENHANIGDVQNSLYLLKDAIENFQKNLSEDFEGLWETISNDSESKEEYEDDEEKSYDFEPLDSVMKTWVEP